MTRNESNLDRVIRVVLGLGLAAAGFFVGAGPFAIVLWVLAGILVVTAITGFCPLYRLFGIDTCRLSKNCEA
jgi:hypothetical protein